MVDHPHVVAAHQCSVLPATSCNPPGELDRSCAPPRPASLRPVKIPWCRATWQCPGRGTVLRARPCCSLSRPGESPSPATKKSGGRTPAGRGTVLCARYFPGPRGRGPSRWTLWEGHSPLCPHLLTDRGDTARPLPAPSHPRRDGRRPRPPHWVQITARPASTSAPGASPHAARLHASRAPCTLCTSGVHRNAAAA